MSVLKACFKDDCSNKTLSETSLTDRFVSSFKTTTLLRCNGGGVVGRSMNFCFKDELRQRKKFLWLLPKNIKIMIKLKNANTKDVLRCQARSEMILKCLMNVIICSEQGGEDTEENSREAIWS